MLFDIIGLICTALASTILVCYVVGLVTDDPAEKRNLQINALLACCVVYGIIILIGIAFYLTK